MAKGKMGNHHGVTSPDEKMGRLPFKESSSVKKVLKKRAAKKRRQHEKNLEQM